MSAMSIDYDRTIYPLLIRVIVIGTGLAFLVFNKQIAKRTAIPNLGFSPVHFARGNLIFFGLFLIFVGLVDLFRSF